ncbi:MAG: chromosome segregation Cse1 [Lasallia pustulata]|uniref:Chromosome segregation Cse1 n=1 Tax=Lasallia pustulata TaxID=136370 RepID=A0A5M8PE61_9LECA|nr:MAG: chromosome segregation Cse1 [Lasallia pustulata]
MAPGLQRVAQLLEAGLDPSKLKQAELAIRQEEMKPGFSVCLLQIVASEGFSRQVRLASALYFKNFIKRNWTDEEGNYKLPQDEVAAIKHELIGLMISVPPSIQSQLGEAIGVIADSDFWERWDTLVDDLVARLTPDSPAINNGVLQVAHSIFKRWRPLYRSDELYTEINHVLSKFGNSFLSLLESTDGLIESNQSNQAKLQQVFGTLNLIMKLFYDLSSQDLPPIFEDNLPAITSLLHKYLTYDNPLLHTDNESEAGSLEFVKAGIFEVLVLYVQKYEDAFGAHVGQFINSSWNLLTTIGPETKYDILTSRALQFLTSVTKIQQHAQGFNDESTLGQVVEKVILPNLSLRDSDIEMFEDEPIEFIRRDLEGSDSDTRRRAATNFLRQLMEQFEKTVTDVVLKYVDHYLADYSTNPDSNWKSKDTAVFLFSSIAAKGVVTASQGVKSTNEHVNLIDFFQSNIANDLISDSGVEPILKVDAIKYLYTFRSQMSREQWGDAFSLLVKHLGSSNYVVYSYAAIAIERVLALTDEARRPIVTQTDVAPLSRNLLEHLFHLIEKDPAPEKIQENEFLMRCVMRVLIIIRDDVVSFTDSVLAHFVTITQLISANPSNPRFYYYHFEALGTLIRFAAPSQPEKLEARLYSPFASILQNEVSEFTPYVFQLFAALLEANPSASLSEYYQSLVSPILAIEVWVSKGNVPALVRLLTSIIPRGATEIAKNNQLEPILGIFQQLVATRTNEIYAFELLECIVSIFPTTTLENYYLPILQMLLTRLQNSKTETFTLRFVRFYHFMSAKDDTGLGADFFINVVDQIQSGVFVPLYLTIILPDTQKLARPLDRKTAVISLTKTLTDSSAFAERYKKGWAYTCEALLKLLENPPVPAATDDLIVDQDVDDMSFGVGFTQLTTIKKPPGDQWPEVTDVKRWVGEYLKAADSRHKGKIARYVQERLSPEAREVLLSYMQN